LVAHNENLLGHAWPSTIGIVGPRRDPRNRLPEEICKPAHGGLR